MERFKIVEVTPGQPYPRIRPIYLMHEAGVAEVHISAILEGIDEVLRIASMQERIVVVNCGEWRHKNWRSAEGELIPHHSIDWYIQVGRKASTRRNQLEGTSILHQCSWEPWQEEERHYDVVVLQSDMYTSQEDNNNFVIGLAGTGTNTIVSVRHFLGLRDQKMQAECIKTETMHEIGHVFGLIPDDRRHNVEFSLGKHCLNLCVMRQGLTVPSDWVRITEDRLQSGCAFCPDCQRDLQRYFGG